MKIDIGYAKMLPLIFTVSTTVDALPSTELSTGIEGERQIVKYINNYTDNKTTSYSDNLELTILKLRFKDLVSKWDKETIFSSSVTEIIQNKNFQEILRMGHSAIPFIIESLEKRPSQLVWALNIITGKVISSDSISLDEASKRWVKAYKKLHYESL